MAKGRARFAALLAGVAAPIYFLIQILLGSDVGDAAIRAVIFFVVLFVVSLAIDWDKRAQPKAEESSDATRTSDEPIDLPRPE